MFTSYRWDSHGAFKHPLRASLGAVEHSNAMPWVGLDRKERLSTAIS